MPRVQLTDREDDVCRLAAVGLSNDEIAVRLGISRRTVETHMRALFRKTGVTRRAQLATLDREAAAGPESPAPPSSDGGDALAVASSQQGRELAHCQRQLEAYAAVVHGLVDRQFPLFEERVEITAIVGEQDEQDVVIERRWTRPRPYLVYRILGPIVTWPKPFETDELALDCSVDGQDTHVDVHPVRDMDGRPLVMVLFQPGLQAETEWMLRYHSPRLWAPLRRSGQDTLGWATATLDQRHPPKITELTLKIVLPDSWTRERLTEHGNRGAIHTEHLPTGQTQLTWRHEAPTAGAYHWLLEAARAT